MKHKIKYDWMEIMIRWVLSKWVKFDKTDK